MQNVKALASAAYQAVVVGNQKAIIALVLSGVTLLGVQVGGVNLLDASVGDVVSAVVGGVITAVGVWFQKNQ